MSKSNLLGLGYCEWPLNLIESKFMKKTLTVCINVMIIIQVYIISRSEFTLRNSFAFFSENFISPLPPQKKKIITQSPMGHDSNSTYQTKASVTHTDFRHRFLSQWHCYEHGRSIFKRNRRGMLHMPIYLAMTIATQIAE